MWCQVHSSHSHANRKTSLNYNSKQDKKCPFSGVTNCGGVWKEEGCGKTRLRMCYPLCHVYICSYVRVMGTELRSCVKVEVAVL